MTDCFHCGDQDHLSYDCPTRTRRTRTPPAVWPSATAAPQPTPQPPPVPPRRPADQIADPQPWADAIRDAMGWSRTHRNDRFRELARRQAAESRREHWWIT